MLSETISVSEDELVFCSGKTIHDRDINAAASNIRDEGLQLLAGGHLATASGEKVRPSKGTVFARCFSLKEECPCVIAGEL
ncbi:hypothetical protein QT970_09975 [Microcoleus sp. herbarium8]|uniref:hypothetical protein n=1 Tax=Microcoleus sp. herbarium8 TaxID=3055436 RepID=UPI002FD77AA6